jgi:acetyl-CoA carboxylase alpha subunit
VYTGVAAAIKDALDELDGSDPKELVAHRYDRLRAIGDYAEAGPTS